MKIEINTFEYHGYNNHIMINRTAIINAIKAGLERSRVVDLIGPRQCGKTTLARTELETHPKLGASWEGYALEEVIKAVEPEQAYFWATHSGAELDLLLIKDGRHYGVGCKRVDAPRMTASMRTALDDLKLEHIAVVYPGKIRYPLEERVTAVPLQDFARPDLKKLF